jgi:hypothetical protein
MTTITLNGIKKDGERGGVEIEVREISPNKYAIVTGSGGGDLTVDVWGIQKTSLPKSLFHGMWTFDIPASMWFMYENGVQVYVSTDITSSGGAAKLLTDATNTTLLLESRECPRYQPNRGHLFSTALWMPLKTADGVRDFGLFTAENGVFFRLKSDGLLYAVRKSGGAEVQEEVIDTSVISGYDPEKSYTYDIQYQWRSAGDYLFYIGDPGTGFSKLVHKFNLLGTLTSASMENPALPIAYKATRATGDVEINIGCSDITSENGAEDVEQYESAYAENVSVNGANVPVLVVRQPAQINSTTNTRSISLARISFNCSKKSTFKVWTTRNPADITGATFKAIGDGSYVETDSPDMDATAVRATSVTAANLNFVMAINVQQNTRASIDNPSLKAIKFPIVRGDYLVVTNTATTATSDVVIEWGEQV